MIALCLSLPPGLIVSCNFRCGFQMHQKRFVLIRASDLGPKKNGLISIIAIFTLTRGVFNYGSFYLTGQIKTCQL